MLDAATIAPLHPPQQVAALASDPGPAPRGSRPVWCVVAAKPKAERIAHAELHRRGFDAYLPLITTQRRDRSWHTGPLWAGYLFVRMRLDQPWNPVRYCPGVFSLLSANGVPSICPDMAVEGVRSALQAAEVAGAETAQETLYRPGALCEANYGGGGWHTGIVLSVGQTTALVSLMMFGYLREITVSLDCLRPRCG